MIEKEENVGTKIVTFNIDNFKNDISAFDKFKQAIVNDQKFYAWAMFGTIYMSIFESGNINNEDAYYAAAKVMQKLFKINITQHENYCKSYKKIEEI